MESKLCMNVSCRATATQEWKKGWSLRSGGFADLCYNCGSAYENSIFCDIFHSIESGWRDCSICGKKIHCGCIASKLMFEYLDMGGVGCAGCAKNAQIMRGQICYSPGGLTLNNIGNLRSTFLVKGVVNDRANDGKLVQPCKTAEVDASNCPSQSKENICASVRKTNGEAASPVGQVLKGFSDEIRQGGESPQLAIYETDRPRIESEEVKTPVAQPSLSIGLGATSGTPSFIPSTADTKEQSTGPSSLQQGQLARHILRLPLKAGNSINLEAKQNVASQIRIARPPAEGRGKNQLLPRYWPRITDQELLQLSAHFSLNSTVMPLFEKVLSASDAGRIGRLVLPKACAEAYFPNITHSDGVPIKVQDVNGREWTFQFRFWPNNNSRMYVLEGVTPCIMSMQLNAGDTVIFSRIDPGNKLVMGFRKASNSSELQDCQTSALPNANGDVASHKTESTGGCATEDLRVQPVQSSEKKRTRNIGSKIKRLLIHSKDALEIRLTWEEAQELLRPPPCVMPSLAIIEDHVFEEYDVPPVFGKRTIFTTQPSGKQEQWAQCDNCTKWRKLPVDVLLSSEWTCSDNVWDSTRRSCSVPDELSPKDLDNLLRTTKGFKKRKIGDSHKTGPEREPSGLDALASAAVYSDIVADAGDLTIGMTTEHPRDIVGDAGDPSIGATTKHPRHRPGCSCIVCIQPPSGKGKHKSSCTCNVCMTVKRRFKTLMLRKKKRQSEREADISQKNLDGKRVELEINDPSTVMLPNKSDTGSMQNGILPNMPDPSTGQLDLNSHPEREDTRTEVQRVGRIISQEADNTSTSYTEQNGSLKHEQHGTICSTYQKTETLATGDSMGKLVDEVPRSSVALEHENKSTEANGDPS